MQVLLSRYEPQVEGMDESRMRQELESMNNELLKKLQELDTDIIFSTGWYFLRSGPQCDMTRRTNLFSSHLRPRVCVRRELHLCGHGDQGP